MVTECEDTSDHMDFHETNNLQIDMQNMDQQILCERLRITDQAMNAAMDTYTLSIKRLETMLGINGVILTISLQTIFIDLGPCVGNVFRLFALLMSFSTIICIMGLARTRMTKISINPNSKRLKSCTTLKSMMVFEIEKKQYVNVTHLKMNESVWNFIKLSEYILVAAIFVLTVGIAMTGIN